MALVALLISGCGDETPTGHFVDLAVRYPAGLELEYLVLEAVLPRTPPGTMRTQVPEEPRPLSDTMETVVLGLPEDVVDEVTLGVEGWSADALVAAGTVVFEPTRPAAEVTLARLTCDTPPCDDAPIDAGVEDAANTVDADVTDAGVPDAAVLPDAGAADAAPADAGPTAGATHLAFVGFPASVEAGACVPLMVERRDASDTAVTELIGRDITLNVLAGAVEIHSASDCARPTTTARIPVGGTSDTFYVTSATLGRFELTATSAGLIDAAGYAEVLPAAAALTVDMPQLTLTWDQCGWPITIGLVDAQGASIPNTQDREITLSVTPPEGIGIDTTPGCNGSSGGVTLQAGASSMTVYLRALRVGTISALLAAQDLTPALLDVTVQDATGSCATCSSTGACYEPCAEGQSCDYTCANGCTCQVECGRTTASCGAVCTGGASCLLDCRGANECAPRCSGGARCVVDCTGATSCDGVQCGEGASCLIDCAGADTCSFSACQGGQLSCPSNIIVCNRACP